LEDDAVDVANGIVGAGSGTDLVARDCGVGAGSGEAFDDDVTVVGVCVRSVDATGGVDVLGGAVDRVTGVAGWLRCGDATGTRTEQADDGTEQFV
jgi:hypothetical protein